VECRPGSSVKLNDLTRDAKNYSQFKKFIFCFQMLSYPTGIAVNQIFFLITGYGYVALKFQTNILKCQHLIKQFSKELFGAF
jgi:hypothetical protein